MRDTIVTGRVRFMVDTPPGSSGHDVTDNTAAFFGRLDRLEHEPLLSHCTGSVRFDLSGDTTEHWLVRIKRGDVSVTHEDAAADCVVRAAKPVFESLAGGEANAMAAVMRGAVDVEGDLGLMIHLQRLLPGPPGSQRPPVPAEARDAR